MTTAVDRRAAEGAWRALLAAGDITGRSAEEAATVRLHLHTCGFGDATLADVPDTDLEHPQSWSGCGGINAVTYGGFFVCRCGTTFGYASVETASVDELLTALFAATAATHTLEHAVRYTEPRQYAGVISHAGQPLAACRDLAAQENAHPGLGCEVVHRTRAVGDWTATP